MLLSVQDSRYYAYSLRRLREELRDKRDQGAVFSETATRIWDALKGLFAGIASGDSAVGLPTYNGGLFEEPKLPLLARVRIADSALAPILDELSRRAEHTLRGW